ncbi:MAG: FG-GAP-like repeat-containing protein [Gammaproteobacteria bacterium]|nr:FG-GAP-like repeat-containing protein [Gammaproteobacteria bacterium]
MKNSLRSLLLIMLLSGCEYPADGTDSSDSISPENIMLNNQGVALMGQYDYEAARGIFETLVEQEPDWLEAKVNLAIAFLNRQREGDEHIALSIVTEVLQEDPEQIRALYVSGIIHFYIGEPEQATAFFNRVVTRDAQDAYAVYFLGQSYLQMGDYEQSARWLLRAAEIDPYLRSAYWAGAQVLRRLGRIEESTEMLAGYQRFAPNPAARLAAISYKRMGPKAEALSVITAESPAAILPAGPLFAEPQLIDDRINGSTVTTADLTGDSILDIVVTTPAGMVVYFGTESGFTRIDDHPLSTETADAAMWGDVNDDGSVDVVLCDDQGSRLVLQTADSFDESTTLSAKPCKAGAVFDADHDGDLDLYTTGPQGNELLSNNRDGTFRELAAEMGLFGKAGRQVLVADLDADRDLDIVVINEGSANDIWQNDRTWQYREFPGVEDLRNTSLVAATHADADADGHVEIYGMTGQGELLAWQFDGSDWQRRKMLTSRPDTSGELTMADFDGDGLPELLYNHGNGFAVVNPRTDKIVMDKLVDGMVTAIVLTRHPGKGPGIVNIGRQGMSWWPTGPGRYEFLAVSPTGRSEADQMRSNASGIGTLIKLRTGDRWAVANMLDAHSGPGQSLAPVSIGLGGRKTADYIALEWSDGVSQTELDLAAGELHLIAEKQRQLSSCPVIFAWDGESWRFVSDVLGVGGLGFFVSPGEYGEPRPYEKFLLDDGMLVESNGRYLIKLTEPMEENAYLDAAYIQVYDIPEGWSLVMDERMGILGKQVTGRPITYRRSLNPVRATDSSNNDVLEKVLTADLSAPPPGAVDPRFVGLLAKDQAITLEFDQAIDQPGAVMVADGWVEYPYSQTVFAAWQAGLQYQAATLAARDSTGQWHTVASEFGYPAGMPRKMALPLSDLPSGTDALRLTSNMEIYWDRLQVVFEEPLDTVRAVTLQPVIAAVAKTGFALRTNGPQKVPRYDYAIRSPYWDTKFQRGFYTALGDATPLVTDTDGALAIIGGGEEVHLEFDALPAPPTGMKRHFVLDFRGWTKDMDLYTEHGETVGPLPEIEGIDQDRRESLHARYNVRFQEGL